MDKRIHFFSHKEAISGFAAGEKLGIRGIQANEFAEMGFPIVPGIILDTDIASDIPEEINNDAIKNDIFALLERCAFIVGRKYADRRNPMFLKIVISSSLTITTYPALHNLGLTKATVEGFSKWAGKEFAAHELIFLIRGMLKIEGRINELEGSEKKYSEISRHLQIIDRMLGIDGPSNEFNAHEKPVPIDKSAEHYMDEYSHLFPQGFFEDAEQQLCFALCEAARMFQMDNQNDNDTAVLIAPMVYGNYGKDSCSGDCNSRNVVTGEKKLQGKFFRGKFDDRSGEGQAIEKLDAAHLKELEKIAFAIEEKFKEIRHIRFTIENGKLWLVDQRQVEQKSTQADIKLLMELVNRKIIDKAHAVKSIDPMRLNELLHPVIDPSSVKGMKSWKGGIAGASGAAIGRVYFSTGALLDAYKLAQRKGEDTKTILVVPSSFADDVKAIELSCGVLTAEGGYSAHASVVARQYGKASLVAPELKFRGKKASLGNFSFSEGDYITLNVPFYGEANVYAGTAVLVEPDRKSSGLLEYIDLAKGFLKGFNVRCNADTAKDAALAVAFGAEGLGVCRTEHMFFSPGRIQIFREMLLSDNAADREKALAKLQVMQKEDFAAIFKAMNGKEVTIRLLDSPFHEFMPRNDEELAAYIAHLEKTRKVKTSKREVSAQINALREFNPMLGHRGCRIAVSYPDIYAMQVRAIFEAAYKARSEKTGVNLEIMIPIVMNASELKLIAFGKRIEGSSCKGIVEIENELRAGKKAKPVKYKIGTMIELPAAALGAGEIAQYAAFFSFGTNDLTQTTLGISRDDFTAFMPDYTLYDLINGNPFSTLDPRVKELITLAVNRGRLTRPDLVCGLCGEHGANPANVRFCIEAGLDYISCSPYSVPIAILAAAQTQAGLN